MALLHAVLCQPSPLPSPNTGNAGKEEMQERSALCGLHKLLPLFLSKEGRKFGEFCQRCLEKFSAWLEAVKISSRTVHSWGGSNRLRSEASLSFPIPPGEHPYLPVQLPRQSQHRSHSFPLLSAGESLLVH